MWWWLNTEIDYRIIGDQVKELERQSETTVPKTCSFLMRLDGCGFSKFTKGMNRPFDLRFTDCMIETAKDVVVKFNCRTAFTQSDEITLFFKM